MRAVLANRVEQLRSVETHGMYALAYEQSNGLRHLALDPWLQHPEHCLLVTQGIGVMGLHNWAYHIYEAQSGCPELVLGKPPKRLYAQEGLYPHEALLESSRTHKASCTQAKASSLSWVLALPWPKTGIPRVA